VYRDMGIEYQVSSLRHPPFAFPSICCSFFFSEARDPWRPLGLDILFVILLFALVLVLSPLCSFLRLSVYDFSSVSSF